MLPAFAAPGVLIVDRHDAEVAAPVYPSIRSVFFGGSAEADKPASPAGLGDNRAAVFCVCLLGRTGVGVRHSVSFQLVALAFVVKDRFDGRPTTTTGRTKRGRLRVSLPQRRVGEQFV